MRPGALVRLKNPNVYDFGASLWDSPQNVSDHATGHFDDTQVGIVLETRNIKMSRKASGVEAMSWDSSLVLVGGVVGWTDTVELELVE